MGEVVNLAFLTLDRAENNQSSGIWITDPVSQNLGDRFGVGSPTRVDFKGYREKATIYQVRDELEK